MNVAGSPLASVRVIELAHWVAGPAAGAVLADWGADVVKVEPPGGDPMRHLFRPGPDGPPSQAAHGPAFSAVNRQKRSIELDLGQDAARRTFEALIGSADVLLTNVRPAALERWGLHPDDVRRRHPQLVYCSVTAHGWQGPDRDQAGYDLAGFFARSGVLHQITTRDEPPAPLMNGIGDMFTAMSAVAGILAALTDRRHSGRGRFVEASLLRTGMWAIAGELGVVANGGRARPVAARTECPTPLFNVYRAADGRSFVLVGVEAQRHLPAVLAAIGRPELAGDERFASARALSTHRHEVIALLDEAFAAAPLAQWADSFARHDVWWAPVQSPQDVAEDPQAAAAGAWTTLAGHGARTVDAPIRFDGADRPVVADAPLAGEHGDQLRAELAAADPGQVRR
jgi:crotonobetainyl-CoA:carnitine CoA-transferase CaiB-like acyl-CoA transferase